MSKFEDAIGPLLDHEGGAYVPDDHGRGPSRWGITLATYRERHPQATGADIRSMTRERAAAFYHEAFWDGLNLGLIDDQTVAGKVFDLAVNIGPGTAVKLLQRVAAVREDGMLGPETSAAINRELPGAVLAAIRAAGERHYRALVRVHPKWTPLLPGWLARLNS